MDRDLDPNWRRWASLEAEGREDEADQVFGALFSAVAAPEPDAALQQRIADAVAREEIRRARLAKLATAAGVLMALALAVMLLLQLPRVFRAAMDMSIGAVVWSAVAVDRGADVWTVLGQLARSFGTVVTAPQVTMGLIVLVLVAFGALYALQRMLELEERSSL